MTAASALISVVCGAATDQGLRRRINEDAYLADSPVFLVADGMGGHHAGEVASAAVVEEFAALAGRPSLSIADVGETLDRARRRVEELPPGAGAGAGTTLSGVVIADVDGEGYWLAVNLGDSRTYLLSDGELEQVSVDHSVVQELIDSGELDEQSASSDSRRNIITRAIGGGSDGEPDFWLIPAGAGDRVLVCSDGLSGELTRERIAEVLRTEPHPQSAATRLVREAVEAGGRDNVTALVVDATAVVTRGGDRAHETVPTIVYDLDEDTRPRATAGAAS
ncbi:PP2C family serine/threonine-protein phosphatase [Microbacterium sp. SS28]|uniref:PP2C family protein-serine/threonine phosphatase n=1 Tax=Microbacterium sp. SS28 TaxID=2919948 RepID=UPI001FA98184|nr:protein phosphatase 2C domain-containing protein [Microbacterium sp. SS28]